jgi:uncharacterized membrane protein YfcA
MDTLILCGIGLVAGVLGGLLGVGGSVVMIPAMTEFFGPQQHLYQAAAMIVNFFVVLPAVYQHRRAGAIMGGMVRRMAPLAIAGVVVGVVASEWSVFHGAGQARLVMLFGVFLFVVAARNTLRIVRGGSRRIDTADPGDELGRGWRVGLAAGVPTGIVAGLLGVGGGTVCVPVQNRFLGIPIRNAIANSAATILALSLIGAAGKNYALHTQHPEYTLTQSLHLAAALIPTAIAGSLLGSRLTHQLPLRALHIIFAAFLFIAGGRMVMRGVATLRAEPDSPVARAGNICAPIAPASPARPAQRRIGCGTDAPGGDKPGTQARASLESWSRQGVPGDEKTRAIAGFCRFAGSRPAAGWWRLCRG